jgi:hypothetical protein
VGIVVEIGRFIRLAPLAIGMAACTHTASTTPTVPIAFGRWRPPEGQACYADIQPRELPPVSAVLDSAALVAELRARAPGSVLIALMFDSLGRTERAQVIDRRMAFGAADSVRALVLLHLRGPRNAEGWGARLLASTGDTAALALGRRELCPPMLARIEPLALSNLPIVDREPELTPPPDWILRGAGPPAGPARSTVEKAVAGTPQRATSRVTVDSTSTSPDVTALGADVLTLRVVIDTAGTIAHAEISRAAAASIDRQRLVTELARYRFHPGLEDRVRTAWWVILRIQ